MRLGVSIKIRLGVLSRNSKYVRTFYPSCVQAGGALGCSGRPWMPAAAVRCSFCIGVQGSGFREGPTLCAGNWQAAISSQSKLFDEKRTIPSTKNENTLGLITKIRWGILRGKALLRAGTQGPGLPRSTVDTSGCWSILILQRVEKSIISPKVNNSLHIKYVRAF